MVASHVVDITSRSGWAGAASTLCLPERKVFTALYESRNRHLVLMAELCLYTGAHQGEAQSLRAEYVRNNTVTYVDTKNSRKRAVPVAPEFHLKLKEHGLRIARIFSTIILPKNQRSTFASHFIMNGSDLLTL